MRETEPAPTDRQLMREVCLGRAEAFDELVRRYRPALLRVAQSRLKRFDVDNHLAEDVVQETFLRAFRACRQYDERFNFRTWLWTILLNQCRSHERKFAGRAFRVLGDAPADDPTASWTQAQVDHADGGPLAALAAKERRVLLETLLDGLRPAQADALRLRFFAGLQFQEIADCMGCSLTTAKNRVRAGLLRLSEALEGEAQIAEAIAPQGALLDEGGVPARLRRAR